MDELGELFRRAREFGRVKIFTMSDGKYHCCIEFDTIEHVSLEAKSSFDEITPENAVQAAIDKAIEIVQSIQTKFQNAGLKKLKEIKTND